MTINKVQGQTLQRAGVLLDEPVFTHGQLYVGLCGKVRSCPPVVGVFVCLLSAVGEDVQASTADNATNTSFESINYCTLAACVSYTGKIS